MLPLDSRLHRADAVGDVLRACVPRHYVDEVHARGAPPRKAGFLMHVNAQALTGTDDMRVCERFS